MITLKFSKNSWHYKFISLFKDRYFISDNICGYFWDFFFCCVLAALIFFVTTIVLYVMVVAPIMWGFVMLQLDMFITPLPEAGVGVLLDACALIIAGLFYLFDVWIPAYDEAKRRKDYELLEKGEYKPKKDSFVKAVWNKFHDKTCARIEFGE